MITARDKADCAARELQMRKRVYPRWVAEGKMSGTVADQQVAIMSAIAEDYRELAEREEAQERLL